MATYEVFLKKDGREEFRHAGALDAANDQLALILARESYLRRAEGDRLWLVRRDHLIVADDAFVRPNAEKPHRHHGRRRPPQSSTRGKRAWLTS